MSIHIGTEQQFLSQLVAGLARPFFLQFIKRLFVGVVPVCQFPFVEVVGGIAIAEFRILKNIAFRLRRAPDFIGSVAFFFVMIIDFTYLPQNLSRTGISFAV